MVWILSTRKRIRIEYPEMLRPSVRGKQVEHSHQSILSSLPSLATRHAPAHVKRRYNQHLQGSGRPPQHSLHARANARLIPSSGATVVICSYASGLTDRSNRTHLRRSKSLKQTCSFAARMSSMEMSTYDGALATCTRVNCTLSKER